MHSINFYDFKIIIRAKKIIVLLRTVIIMKVNLQILFCSYIEMDGTADNKFVRQEVSTRLFF